MRDNTPASSNDAAPKPRGSLPEPHQAMRHWSGTSPGEPDHSLFEGIYWHQRWEVAPGVFTPGINDVHSLLDLVGLPNDLRDMRVLDIGAWNGCFSFECERRGAREVIAIGPEAPEATGFDRLKGYLNSSVIYRYGSAYNLDPILYGNFDVVLFFGVLYHLRYPLLALDNIRRVARGRIYVESACIDNCLVIEGSPHRLTDLNSVLEELPILQFFRKAELGGDPSNWFSPSKAALKDMLVSSGFQPERVEVVGHRVYARAQPVPGWPEFLTLACGENDYFEMLMKRLVPHKEDFYID